MRVFGYNSFHFSQSANKQILEPPPKKLVCSQTLDCWIRCEEAEVNLIVVDVAVLCGEINGV